MRVWFVLYALGILCLSAFVLCVVTLSFARAHEAPLGWAYDYECCSGVDCRQAKVRETINGYVVPSGELIPYGDKRVRLSKDEFFHWCTVRGLDTTATLCIYVPNRGF